MASFAKREKSRFQCLVVANYANAVECGQDKDNRKVITTSSKFNSKPRDFFLVVKVVIAEIARYMRYTLARNARKSIFSIAKRNILVGHFSYVFYLIKSIGDLKTPCAFADWMQKDNTKVLINLQLFLSRINKNENNMFTSQVKLQKYISRPLKSTDIIKIVHSLDHVSMAFLRRRKTIKNDLGRKSFPAK